jgi:type IV pilus assembly protein PilC
MDFLVKIKTEEGEEKVIEQSAGSRLELYRDLEAEGVRPLKVKEKKKFSAHIIIDKMKAISTVGLRDKIEFTKNISSMLKAGLPLSRAITIVGKHMRNYRLKKITSDILRQLKKGVSLNEAMRKYEKVFGPLYISMITAGEESGDLQGALRVIAGQQEKSYELKKKVKGAMIYPGVIMFAMITIGVFMMIVVVPTLTKTFKELDIDLPASTRFIIGVSDLLNNNFIAVISLVVVALAAFFFGLKTRQGKRMRDWTILHTPLLSPLVKKVYSAQVARTLSSLLTAGVPFLRSIEIVKDVAQNSYAKEVIQEAEDAIQEGSELSGIFMKAEHVFMPYFGEMMAVGEETGEVAMMLKETAIYFEAEVDSATKNLSTIIEPVLMLIIGGAVGFFAISMISPMYGIVDQV